jgi:hypothetical protein
MFENKEINGVAFSIHSNPLTFEDFYNKLNELENKNTSYMKV